MQFLTGRGFAEVKNLNKNIQAVTLEPFGIV